MPGSRKRAPSTPKKTPKRPRTAKKQGKQRQLPGGALEMSFQLEDAVQAEAAPHQVHSASDAPPAAPGGIAGPSGDHGEEEDPFVTSTPVQPPNQGRFHSSPSETFNLQNVSDGSQEGGGDATVARDPGLATPSHRQRRQAKRAGKAGSQQPKMPDDLLCAFTVDEDGKRVCKFCSALQDNNSMSRVHHYSNSTGTGTLRAHLLNNHPDEWVSKCQSLNIVLKGKEGEEALAKFTGLPLQHQAKARVPFSQEAFLDGLVDFTVATNQSIRIVDREKFRHLCLLLRPELRDVDIPHRTTMHKRIIQTSEEVLANLALDIKSNSLGQVSFTTDLWSDPDQKSYMAVTAHWLELAHLQGGQKKITIRADLVGFVHVPGHHSGDRLAKAFFFIISRMGLAKKIGWVTTDNASNNNTMLLELEGLIKSKYPNSRFSAKSGHIRCFAHIVNLACKAMVDISTLRGNDYDPVQKLRDAISHIRSSSLRREGFSRVLQQLEQRPLQLIRDVETRWSSVYLMITRAIDLKEGIDGFFVGYQEGALTEGDWRELEMMKRVLELPYLFQQALSFEKTPTLCHTVPAFEAFMTSLRDLQLEEDGAEFIISAGIDKLEEYCCLALKTPAYLLSVVLNPYAKLAWFHENYSPEFAAEVKSKLFEALRPLHTPPHPPPQPSTSPVVDPPVASTSDLRSTLSRLGLGKRRGIASNAISLESEVDSYLALPVSFAESIIMYWQEHQHQWPTLFKLAMDLLPAQATSVPCERVFSASKETTTARRNRLTPKIMEATQILKFQANNKRQIDFTEGLAQEEELGDLEEREVVRTVEDVGGFLNSMREED